MKRPFPKLSVFSLFPAFVFGFGSYPLWVREFADGSTGNAAFPVVVAIITCSILTAGLGAIYGAVLALIAHFRRERLIIIRAVSLLINVTIVGYALYVWLALRRA